MRGRIALAAEIVGRADDALAEVALPDAVDHDAGEQRIVGRGQPQGERFAALRNEENVLRLDDRRAGIERREESGLHLLALRS